jgi:hypothetical protein
MRVIFGVLSLLVVLAIAGILVKKQFTMPSATSAPLQTPQQQSDQAQQQYKRALESALQQPRPMPEDQKQD